MINTQDLNSLQPFKNNLTLSNRLTGRGLSVILKSVQQVSQHKDKVIKKNKFLFTAKQATVRHHTEAMA